MRRIYACAAAVLALGCSDSPSTTAPRLNGAIVNGADADRQGFGTDHGEKRLVLTLLTGDEEVPPRETPAHGQSHVRLSKDGLSMDYVLVANDISNVIMAHIHVGAKGVNGPVRVWLYPSTSPGALTTANGPHNGLLAQGSFDASNLQGITWADFIAAVAAGNAYVNVHTNDFVGAQNTGPGDFPGGEIRGQLDKNGH